MSQIEKVDLFTNADGSTSDALVFTSSLGGHIVLFPDGSDQEAQSLREVAFLALQKDVKNLELRFYRGGRQRMTMPDFLDKYK